MWMYSWWNPVDASNAFLTDRKRDWWFKTGDTCEGKKSVFKLPHGVTIVPETMEAMLVVDRGDRFAQHEWTASTRKSYHCQGRLVATPQDRSYAIVSLKPTWIGLLDGFANPSVSSREFVHKNGGESSSQGHRTRKHFGRLVFELTVMVRTATGFVCVTPPQSAIWITAAIDWIQWRNAIWELEIWIWFDWKWCNRGDYRLFIAITSFKWGEFNDFRAGSKQPGRAILKKAQK